MPAAPPPAAMEAEAEADSTLGNRIRATTEVMAAAAPQEAHQETLDMTVNQIGQAEEEVEEAP